MVKRHSKRLKSKVDDDDDKEISISAASKFMSIIIPDDLLLEILVRLPHAKFVIKSSTVCKRWYSLINSEFISRFIQYHNDNDNGTTPYSYTICFREVFRDEEPFYEIFPEESKLLHNEAGIEQSSSSSSMSPLNPYLNFLPWDRVAIQASFDDLLLVTPEYLSIKEYCICNPLTKQWRVLPKHPIEKRYHITCGFLCNKKPNGQYSYKIVVITRGHVTIFCSETKEWSASTFLFKSFLDYGTFLCDYSFSVARDGIIYWLLQGLSDEVKGIFAFDPFVNGDSSKDPKRVHIIDLPVDFDRGLHTFRRKVCLGLVRGRLRLSQLVKVKGVSCLALKVWELNFDKDNALTSWFLVHDVNFRKAKEDKICVLAFHPNNGEDLVMVRNQNVYKYKIGEDKYEKIGRFPGKFSRDTKQKLSKYVAVFTLMYPSWPTAFSQYQQLLQS